MAIAWLDLKWENPSADQFYLMQVAAQVKKVLHKDPNSVDINDFKIPFERANVDQKKEEVTPLTMEQATAISMSKWFAVTGYQPGAK